MDDLNCEMDFFSNEQPKEISVDKFDGLCKQAWDQRLVCEEIESKLKVENKILESIKFQIVKALEATNRDSYASPYGTVYRTERSSVSVPKDPEAREAFFGYLKQKGVFEDLITVHSQTLNSWYKQEKEAAEAAGNFHLTVDGLGEPNVTHTLTMRGTKK